MAATKLATNVVTQGCHLCSIKDRCSMCTNDSPCLDRRSTLGKLDCNFKIGNLHSKIFIQQHIKRDLMSRCNMSWL
ncbi:hypothetical protein CCACVL1_12665 [Corchorus capsularis]|uniref:Uncharacterized protein n=1 Tax=Corchorus capsularis TaxID=210143 RepID=A0A1R3IEH5_COCAP|nr:hypothetical protein CCACVL1_12665 [Corchorus capsularis]